jgi:hypothetical protein
MLGDICRAVELSANWFMKYEGIAGLQILSQYPDVLTKCDELDFNDPSQAAAYLIVHPANRYCRVWQVLEKLLKASRLPLEKMPNFPALDIGAGSGPSILAVRHDKPKG